MVTNAYVNTSPSHHINSTNLTTSPSQHYNFISHHLNISPPHHLSSL
ncbi:MAG: hypothetical protein MR788_08875 [Prevotella sp.]|nr:hypothetical protein [Prevotella sp.]